MDKRVKSQRQILKYEAGSLNRQDDLIAVESPLTIVINGQEFATMVCTPEHMEDLVIGFLASEGIIRLADEIQSLSVSKQGFAYVELERDFDLEKDASSKRFIGSCCGKSRQFYFQNDVKTAKTVMNHRLKLSLDHCFALMDGLNRRSSDFIKTGGVHNAALCTTEEIIISRTDIGRHNALDKIYGYCLKHKIRLGDKLIVFSGRISSEVLLKISKIGVGILLSKSAPTDLALELADDLGITTVGFIRNQSMNIYTHPDRIVTSDREKV
ncbi:MAG: formate dehydrogenase accessory sulfurtransferase FdhD [Bacillaceae bacterium]|nr:formate dehydrogenase accessory sulfurtransferase FdhD [Bacillaceae bacterium]